MLQDDYILRQIREMVRAVMKMLFQVSAPELTPEVIEDKDARQTLESLTSLADEGKIDEAENRLYEMTCDGDRQNLEIGLLFYYELNGKDALQEQIHSVMEWIKGSSQANPNEPILFPGDIEQITFKERLDKGIPLSEGTISELLKCATQLGIQNPENMI